MNVQGLLRSSLLRFAQAPDNQRFQDDFFSSLNDAQQDFANRRRWGFLRTTANLTTVADTRTVALPSDFGKPYDVRGTLRVTSPTANSGTDIELMPYEDWAASQWEDGSSTGTPAYAYLMGDSVYFSPIPDAAYTVSMVYFKAPPTIADASSTITIPDRYGELLQKLVYRRLQDAGYAAIQEMQISDMDIAQLMNRAARDDIARYGGLTFNLNPSAFDRRET